MRVEAAMTRDVETVGPDKPLKQVAAMLFDYQIGGMPVVDESGRVLGIISKTDIVTRQRARRENRSWMTLGKEPIPNAGPHTAGEVMRHPAITIAPDASLETAAERMINYGLNRLPVVYRERLVGIITRHDLVGAFARDDAEIEQEIREQALNGLRWPEALELRVHDGEVDLRGQVDTIRDAQRLPVEVGHILGVISVDAELTARDGERNLAITTHL